LDRYEALRKRRSTALANPVCRGDKAEAYAENNGYMPGKGCEICMEAGMEGYLEKPIEVSALFKAVERPTRITMGGSLS
jgi:CheY-like chemotaxis protein